MSSTVTRSAPAKVNLFLRVLAREADGYHGIETLLCLTDLADSLQATTVDTAGVTIAVSGADTGPDQKNLAVRAAEMVLAATGQPFGVSLTLSKHIPVRAGLGGGSSDAAAALVAVNELTGSAIPRHELLQFAARLGSDVPFFVSEARLALGWGHGERLLRLAPLPSRPGLLLIPGVGVDTAEAYGWIDDIQQATRRGAVVMGSETLHNWSDVARLSGNDFEAPVFGRHPEIRLAFEALVGTNPLMCRMSGSGSALVAIYRSARDRDDAQAMVPPKLGRVIPFATA
ncbi:MAG: 4-(cytidine 5'-diphospho)-2-C-methyl-D-erythritol kinase [Gemmatimonadales bacterium]